MHLWSHLAPVLVSRCSAGQRPRSQVALGRRSKSRSSEWASTCVHVLGGQPGQPPCARGSGHSPAYTCPRITGRRRGCVGKELGSVEPVEEAARAADLWPLTIGPQRLRLRYFFLSLPLTACSSFPPPILFPFRVFISFCFKFHFKIKAVFVYSLKTQIVLGGLL